MALRLKPGEPEAGPWRVLPVEGLVEELRSAADHPAGRPRIIGLDGRGGAGKSVLADRLRRAVPSSAVVHTDDVAWNHAYFDWGGLLSAGVLEPLRRGEAVNFRPPAWAEWDRPGSITVPTGLDTVWVEGTGLIRRELASLLDATAWVQCDLDEAERRIRARDGDSPEQLQHEEAWEREEDPFLLDQRPWARATLVIYGSPDVSHDPERQLVVAPPVE